MGKLIKVFMGAFFVFASVQHSFSQVPVANLSQAPLLLHPGLAGSKGVGRLALLANKNDYYVPVVKEPREYHHFNQSMSFRSVYEKTSNFYLSYDKLVDGYGFGAFTSVSTTRNQANSNDTYKQNFGSFQSNDLAFGIAVSPKLKMSYSTGKKAVNYTLSPSFLLGYKTGSQISSMFIPYDNLLLQPETLIEKIFQIQQLTGQVGLMVHSRRGYFGYNLGTFYDFTNEKATFIDADDSKKMAIRHSFLAWHHSACFGLVFPQREDAAFTFSPVTTVGMTHALMGNRSESIYLAYLKTGSNWLGYLHQSFNFKLYWSLFGLSYTEYQNQRMEAYHLGFKHNRIRLLMFYSFWDHRPTKMEASLTYLID